MNEISLKPKFPLHFCQPIFQLKLLYINKILKFIKKKTEKNTVPQNNTSPLHFCFALLWPRCQNFATQKKKKWGGPKRLDQNLVNSGGAAAAAAAALFFLLSFFALLCFALLCCFFYFPEKCCALLTQVQHKKRKKTKKGKDFLLQSNSFVASSLSLSFFLP